MTMEAEAADPEMAGTSTTALETSVASGQQATAQSTQLTDELQTLKMKILELEKRAEPPPVPPPLSDEMEQYRRMEKCLYRHRKEWQANLDSTQHFTMEPRSREKLYEFGFPPGPWSYHWQIETEYNRPDPFDPHHQCADDKALGNEGTVDEYDCAIDFGNRRDRLRKNFEWEMDRLYLAEETDLRRRRRLKEAEVERQQQEAPITEIQGSRQDEDGKDEADPAPTSENVRRCAEPMLNRVEWFAFKVLARVPESRARVVDILIGDPIIEDELNHGSRRFGYLRRRSRKLHKVTVRKADSTTPGQAQLPERIRVHSSTLLTILDKILGLEGSRVMAQDGRPIVFLRPFKALAYCEQALREWCATLEKKFSKHSAGSSMEGSGGEKKVLDSSEPKTSKTESGDVNTEASEQIKNEQPHNQDEDDEKEQEDDPNDITRSETALDHLKCLVTFLDEDMSQKRNYLSQSGHETVFFSDLWNLFRPGTEVIRNDGKQVYRVLHVATAKHRSNVDYQPSYDLPGDSKKEAKADVSVFCIYIDFNGQHLGPVLNIFGFKRFEGEKPVRSLTVYPLRYHPLSRADFSDAEWRSSEEYPEAQRFRQKLVRRGAMFLEVAAVRHMYYSGPTLEAREEVESQVVIDFETAFSVEEGPRALFEKPELELLTGSDFLDEEDEKASISCPTCCKDDTVYNDSHIDRKQTGEYIERLLPDKGAPEAPSIALVPRMLKELQNTGPGNSPAVSDEELLIMSHRVYGFILRSRKWAKLDLAYLTDIQTRSEEISDNAPSNVGAKEMDKKKETGEITAFDRLVLPEGHKPMIVSLIAQHFRDKESKGTQTEQIDIVRGKGKGLILLLHGAPGVGKTSTAEGVAELFKKPLFQITCGDLGTTAKEVEKALETNFALANRWGCILLLDEADVFLAERTKEDFKRNGLVAVFLRVLEYYAGILFLTTNRVGDFDEAFTSRIHISLFYPELNQDKTLEVFKINMDMIEERFTRQGRRIEIDKLGIGSFASDHFVRHSHARWNGRQIRNACQTALALAEFEAQGNSHKTILEPDAIVKLTVEHFNTVRNAYLEFTKYMTDLYGSNAARRAKEGKLRAIWLDENDKVVGGDKADFLRASQARLFKGQQAFQQQGSVPRYGSPSQIFPQPQYPPQGQYQPYQQQQGYSFQRQQGFHATDIQPQQSPQPFRDESAQAHTQGQPFGQPPGASRFSGPSQSQIFQAGIGPQEQHQPNSPAWLNQDLHRASTPSGQQGPRQSTPSRVPHARDAGFGP